MDLERVSALRGEILRYKLRGIRDLTEDNLDAIMGDYSVIHSVTRDLINIKGHMLSDIINSHAAEFHFFQTCTTLLKTLVDYYEYNLRVVRASTYSDIKTKSPADLTHQAINQMIDSNKNVMTVMEVVFQVREMYSLFQGVLDSYNQRGYQLNNIIKAIDLSTQDLIL